MTIGEIVQVLKLHREQEEARVKENLINAYNSACLTASFVCCGLNGKKFPSIQEMFPDMFPQEIQQIQEDRDYKAMMLYKEQMIDFAKAHNKKRQATKEGESN